MASPSGCWSKHFSKAQRYFAYARYLYRVSCFAPACSISTPFQICPSAVQARVMMPFGAPGVYVVDLAKSVQINTKTGYERSITRGGAPVTWPPPLRWVHVAFMCMDVLRAQGHCTSLCRRKAPPSLPAATLTGNLRGIDFTCDKVDLNHKGAR